MFLLFEFCCETPPSCLKVRGWVEPESMWWSQSLCGGLEQFSVSPRPLGSLLGLGWGWAYGVWGLRVWGQGLTILNFAELPWTLHILLSIKLCDFCFGVNKMHLMLKKESGLFPILNF